MSNTITGRELMRRWAVGVPKLRSVFNDEGFDAVSEISWDDPKEVAEAFFSVADIAELEQRYLGFKANAEEYEQKAIPDWMVPNDGVVGRQGATGGGEALQPLVNGFAEEEAKRLRQENMELKEKLKSFINQKDKLPARERWRRSVVAAVKATAEIVLEGTVDLTRAEASKIIEKHFDYDGENQGIMAEAESLFWDSLPQELRKQKGRPKKEK